MKPRLGGRVSELEAALAFQIRALGLPAPEVEYRFSHDRLFRFDFCWVKQQVAAECEGAVWTDGRHVTGQGFTTDCVKYNLGALLGYRIFRFTKSMILSGEAVRTLEQALRPGVAE